MISELFASIADWYMAHIDYLTITLLMAIESSFIPLPSEVVIPPAAWKAAQGELNIFLVILFGTLGALIGSLINYFLALIIGRKIIYALLLYNPETLRLILIKEIGFQVAIKKKHFK